MIYLDCAATTPLCSPSKDAWLLASEQYFANTSSLHEPGERARLLLDASRNTIAAEMRTHSSNLFFTSGGSEANLLSLESLFAAKPGTHIITSRVEHPSVTSFFRKKEAEGIHVSYLETDQEGRVSAEEVISLAKKEKSALVSIQLVNSETGVIQPVREISQELFTSDTQVHTDAVQAFGKIPVNLKDLPVDAFTVSAHKISGPKGIGAVYLRSPEVWKSIYPLTSHEKGFRPGTPDTPSAAAFGAAVMALPDIDLLLEQAWEKRNYFLNKLSPLSDILKIEGAAAQKNQSPYIIGLCFEGVQGQYLLASLDRYGVYISTGSACKQGETDGSPMMHALYSSQDKRNRFIRISFSPKTTAEELAAAALKIVEIVRKARRIGS